MPKLESKRNEREKFYELTGLVNSLFFTADMTVRDDLLELFRRLKYAVVSGKVEEYVKKDRKDLLGIDQQIGNDINYREWAIKDGDMETGNQMMRENLQKLSAYRDTAKVHIANLEGENAILRKQIEKFVADAGFKSNVG